MNSKVKNWTMEFKNWYTRGTRRKVYNRNQFCGGDAECERRRAQMKGGKLDYSASRKSRHYPL